MSRKGGESRLLRLLRAYRCKEPVAARRALRAWYGGMLGKRLLDEECRLLDEVLPNLFGYHLLQVGVPAPINLIEASRVSHCMVLADLPHPEPGLPRERCLHGVAAALPIATDSLDVLLLPHTLEFEANPHEVLREADRTLVPEGHVVILMFNPWSLWGLRRMVTGWRDRSPWCGRFLNASRLKDWLALLGFDTIAVRGYFFRPPIHHAGLLHRLRFLERAGGRWWPALGGAYILIARKRVTTLTPIRPRWRSQTRLFPGRVSQAGVRRQDPSA